MSVCADVLRELGFVPVVPAVSREAGTAESEAGRHVPAVPAVPAQKSMGRNAGASEAPATVLHLRADLGEQRRRLAEAMREQGYDARLLLLVPDDDIAGCQWLSAAGLLRYAEILASRFGEPGALP